MILTCDKCYRQRPASDFPLGGSWCTECILKNNPKMTPNTTKENKTAHQPMETEIAPTPANMLKEWNEKFEVTPFIEESDSFARQRFWDLRMKLITEEYKEVMDEMLDCRNGQGSMINLAKELADLKYVIYQAEVLLDIPSVAVFAAVHESNMSKLGTDGKPVRRSDGKILKGPNYHEPDLSVVFGVSD